MPPSPPSSAPLSSFRVRGLCAAVYTPLEDAGDDGTKLLKVSVDRIPLHADALIQQGVRSVFVCGTTGEGGALSVAERKAVLEAWMAAARPRSISVLAHVGAEALPDTLDLAAHAESVGVAAVGVMPPVFFKPHNLDAVVSLLGAVSAAAPHTPLYYYHFPERTGVAINLPELLKRMDASAAAPAPTFRGLKFTDHDLGVFASCVAYGGGKYDILSGRDASFVGALALGGTGAVGSTWNYVGLLGNGMLEAVAAGDLPRARAYARAAARVAGIVSSPGPYGGLAVNVHKAIMEARIGVKGSCGPSRASGAGPMTEAGRAALFADLEAAGFWHAPMVRGPTLVHAVPPRNNDPSHPPPHPPAPLVMPWVGLGTWKAAPGVVASAVTAALEAGYRHIDCAAAYGNEAEVGEALQDAFARGVVRREDLFVTSKLWVTSARPDAVAAALSRTLADLRIDYLDLYLVHWPFSIAPGTPFPPAPDAIVKYSPAAYAALWAALEEEALAGRVRAIGCSNMSVSKLEALLAASPRILPAVNQVECHPFLPQTELLAWCKSRGIVLTAYSPLGSPDRPARLVSAGDPAPLGDTTVAGIAAAARLEPAQVLLRWQLQRGVVVIPKSVNPARIAQTLAATLADQLSPASMAALAGLEVPSGGGRIIKGYPAQGETFAEFWA
jgi:alcohol dehydrogenase (NADP+)